MDTTQTAELALGRERMALRISLWVALALATLGISVGIIGNSQVILFDGFYTLVGVGLTSLALRASSLAGRGPNERYPFGREALVPLVIAVEGVALSATCLYASANAIVELARGGSGVPTWLDLVYAGVVSVLPSLLWWRLSRVRGSELVDSEAQAWASASALGVALVVAFLVARVLEGSRWRPVAAYVDPSLVLVAASLFIVAPVRMMKRTLFELVEGAVDGAIAASIREAVTEVGISAGLSDPVLRMSKVGRKVYVEVGYVVPASWSVAAGDSLRTRLHSVLSEVSPSTWLTLEFSSLRESLL